MSRFQHFVSRFDALLDAAGDDEVRILREGAPLLAALVRQDDWLPADCARAPAAGYCQYRLHCDSRNRYSVVSFVWAPGARTPIHDHTVWGMVGVMRGAETCYEYAWPQPGAPMVPTTQHRLEAGSVDKVSPRIGDIHVVENACADRPSISIHVYGADIGRLQRHAFDASTGVVNPFVSGYSNA
jgi:predicted metal-dependent enzyme (double-stranded beta helix superfamily)